MHYLNNLWAALEFGSLWDMLLRLAAVLLCLTVHETCHGLAAYALGDPTARQAHRLSLNPLRHIDWFGLLMMFLAGFGWAKPVPVNPNYFKKPKQGMALTFGGKPANIGFYFDGGYPFYRLGAFQPDPHSAAGRVQGTVCGTAGPGL